jgi:hypothetical protein
MKLFFTGFLQVFFVAINTFLISNNNLIGVFICSSLISFIWSYNVKKIIFSSFKNHFIYSLGAGLGALLGLMFCINFLK